MTQLLLPGQYSQEEVKIVRTKKEKVYEEEESRAL